MRSGGNRLLLLMHDLGLFIRHTAYRMAETLEVDVLIVGGGPAGLRPRFVSRSCRKPAAGNRCRSPCSRRRAMPVRTRCLAQCSTRRHSVNSFRTARRKASRSRSGPPRSRLLPDQQSKLPFPIIPPPLQNHGNVIVSLNALVRWLSEQVEKEGVDLFTGFAGREVLLDGTRVIGVRTGDRGIAKDGSKKSEFEPGVEILAKVTIFCDGVRGNLTKEIVQRLDLSRDREPEQYAVGLKELWEVPEGRIEPGTVIHTLGYPLRRISSAGDSLRDATATDLIGLCRRTRLPRSVVRSAHGLQPLQAASVRDGAC